MTDSQLCTQHYGNPESKAFINTWLVRCELPADVVAIWPRYPGIKKPITAVYMNKFAFDSLIAVMRELIHFGLDDELATYDGCTNVRQKRGVNEYSIHSWGLALDFNAALNPLGQKMGAKPKMFTKAFLDVWARHNWVIGMYFSRPDGMHFQYTKLFPN